MKLILLVVGMVLLCSNVYAIEFKNTNHTITFEINDTVYEDNKNIYIECSPHTIYRDSYVYFNFSFKSYKGNADIYLGFIDNSYPVNISLFDGKKYIDLKQKIETTDCEYDKKDYWYYIDNIPTKDNNSIRIWLNISKGIKNGKYDFAIKPTGKSMSDSINDKKFYVLDPYYETFFNTECPCSGNNPCNNIKFIDLGDKKFLYLQTSYLCGDVNGDNGVGMPDARAIIGGNLNCLSPIINYEILNYSHYVGTNIIRPNRSEKHD